MEASALSTFITNVGTVITACGTWIGSIVTVIVENPPLLVSFGIGIGAGAIGLFNKLRR